MPSETLHVPRSENVSSGVTDPLEVPHMTYLQHADGILRDTLRRMDAPYHVRVATAYAWLAARESRAPIPIPEIAGRLTDELGSEITSERALTILQVRPNEVHVIEALARVLNVDPGWLLFGPSHHPAARTTEEEA